MKAPWYLALLASLLLGEAALAAPEEGPGGDLTDLLTDPYLLYRNFKSRPLGIPAADDDREAAARMAGLQGEAEGEPVYKLLPLSLLSHFIFLLRLKE